MKKNAYTMIEMLIAFTFIAIIASVVMANFKPNLSQSKILLYSAIDNITKGNIALQDQDTWSKTGASDYCFALANVLSVKGTVNCSDNNSPNITFPNGIQIKGLAGVWKTPSATDFDPRYSYRDIVVDINGFSSSDKIFQDYFPLRIYKDGVFDGGIMPVNCYSNDTIYDNNNNSATITKSTYCSGSDDYTKMNEYISFDVYKPDRSVIDSNGEISTTLIKANVSPAQADCLAYGGEGVYTSQECTSKGYAILPECQDVKCFALIHKPSVGAGLIIDTLVKDMY